MSVCSPLLYTALLGLLAASAAAQKNVLFIVVDDLRPEIGAYYNNRRTDSTYLYPKISTPNMDALADKSLLFKNAYSQYSICCPSRSSYMTSRRPDSTMVYDKTTYWREAGGNFTTIPQHFKDSGYLTVGMGKIYHPGAQTGDDDPISWSTDYDYYHGSNSNLYGGSDFTWQAFPQSTVNRRVMPDQDLKNRAITILNEVYNGAQPFFMAVGFQKPHLPFTFPESYLDLYPEADIALAANNAPPTDMPSMAWSTYGELTEYGDMAAAGITGELGTTMPDSTALELRRAYYAAVSYIDGLVGELTAELETLGIADNTLITLVGDHGWQLGDHAEWAKQTNFEEAVRVPMILKVPGQTDSGMVSDHMVEMVDLFPTLVEAAGLTALTQCSTGATDTLCTEGSSLMPLVTEGDSASWKDAAFSQMKVAPHRMSYTVRTARYRYTEILVYDQVTELSNWNKVRGRELYDYETDPQGDVNQASNAAYSTAVTELSTKLRAGWEAALPSAAKSGANRARSQLENLLMKKLLKELEDGY